MGTDFSVAVVGLGLVGSGALRHAAAAGSVVGIGPGEPEDWAAHEGVFSSHYDSGRVTRRLDARREWAVLASRAIEQYAVIEQRSGVRFHEPVGMAYVRSDPEGVALQRAVAAELGIAIEERPAPAPYRFPTGWTCLLESAPAGHIDPRKMVEAQHSAARADGAEIVRTEITSVERSVGGFRLRTAGGSDVTAGQVIIATGCYGNQFTQRPLAVSIRSEAVILCEVEPSTAAALEMPSSIWLIDHPEFFDIYVVPPVKYPDGRWYLKVGGAWTPSPQLNDEASLRAWMQGTGADDRMALMRGVVDELLPEVPFISYAMKPCVIADTATGLPFVGIVDDGRIVARGGNGHAAKSGDAIGALAVRLALTGEWNDPDLDQDQFLPRFG